MNQILVTDKIYVTPELKRKKKMYKVLFMLSIFAIIVLFAMYVYAEYDRNKEDDISKDILTQLANENEEAIASSENALVVLITQEMPEMIEEANEIDNTNTPAPTSTYTAPDGKTYETICTINIPKIGVNYPVSATTTTELLKQLPCRFWGGSPNEVGNLSIVGHNYRNSRFFSKVPTLVVGDIVEITDLSQRTIQYEVYDIHTVLPDNTDDTDTQTNGRKEVTLITCTNDTKQRVIVRCKEKV